MSDESIARVLALLIVGLFFVGQVFAYINPRRPVPAELYPLVTMAVGYLLGHRLLRDAEIDKPKPQRRRKK